jgi:hypothetical protein
MTLPNWLLQLGSLAGLLTLLFTIIDRLFTGRPMMFIRPAGYNTRDFICFNPSKFDILVKKIKTYPRFVGIAEGQSPSQIAGTKTPAPGQGQVLNRTVVKPDRGEHQAVTSPGKTAPVRPKKHTPARPQL